MNSGGRNSNVSTKGLWSLGTAVSLVASFVVVMGLVSISAASAAPSRAHAAYRGASRPSLTVPHAPVDTDAPLNSVYAEAYIGNAAPVIVQATPSLPTYSSSGGVSALSSGWSGANAGAVQFTSGTPIVAGRTYTIINGADAADTASVAVGPWVCSGAGSIAAFAVDQLVVVGGVVQTLAFQFDCVTADGNNELLGTIAYNASPSTPGQGYYLYGAAGELGGFGNDEFLNYLGDLTTVNLNQPIVGMATTPSGGGYWMVATDGGIFSFGDAAYYGSTGAIHLNKPIVGMAATPDAKGYWLVASDGGIFSFGDAAFYGSTGAIHLNKPIVGMASTPDGKGYWLVASDGGIFTFGDATFHGSMGGMHLNAPIVGLQITPDGNGYLMAASDGGVFAFGDAVYSGSLGGQKLNQPVIGIG
jgi:hypothetical protein